MTATDVQKAARQAARKIRKLPPTDITVGLWLVGFREFFPTERNAESAVHDAYMLKPFIERHGRKLLSAVTALMAQEWANKNPGQVRYLREAWEKAIVVDFVQFNVWSAVRLPKRSIPQRPVPSQDQLDAALARARTLGGWYAEEFADLVRVAAYTGVRSGGLAALERQAVDLEAKRVTVTEKGRKTRLVALLGPAHDAAYRACLRWEVERVDWLGRPLLFRSKRGKPLNREIIGSAWGEIRGDFPGPFHSLKHFAGTWLAREGVDERDIAIQLGHTDSEGRPYTQLVRRVYNHPDHDEALARIEAKVYTSAMGCDTEAVVA